MKGLANRLEGIGEYYFSTKLREIDALNRAGRNVINLGIGSPDLPPHPEVIRVLQDEAAKPNVHAYQNYKGSPILRKAIAEWYATWYGVDIDPETEVLPLIGSKEGIMHICMTYLNAGDEVLLPNPGYPTYHAAVKLAGATPVPYLLDAKNNWQPDWQSIRSGRLDKVKIIFVNYPHMPTGTLPDRKNWETLIRFAQEHQVLVVHDNPYSFILNEKPESLLSVPGAKEVVLELNSLSKSHNMAGWRVGMLCASKERIDEVLRFKSNMDSGMFLPVQLAAARALSLDRSWYDAVNVVYQSRRKKAYQLLDTLKCTYDTKQVGMFLWAKIPGDFSSGYELSDKVLRESAVFITPGGIFGTAGESYVRVSLCSTEEKFAEAVLRVGGGWL